MLPAPEKRHQCETSLGGGRGEGDIAREGRRLSSMASHTEVRLIWNSLCPTNQGFSLEMRENLTLVFVVSLHDKVNSTADVIYPTFSLFLLHSHSPHQRFSPVSSAVTWSESVICATFVCLSAILSSAIASASEICRLLSTRRLLRGRSVPCLVFLL